MRSRTWEVRLDGMYKLDKATRRMFKITFSKMLTVKRRFRRKSV